MAKHWQCSVAHVLTCTNFSRAFRLATSSIMLTSSSRSTAFSIYKIASPDDSQSCCIVCRRYVFINLSFENDLSPVTAVMGDVRDSKTAVCKSGNVGSSDQPCLNNSQSELLNCYYVIRRPEKKKKTEEMYDFNAHSVYFSSLIFIWCRC